MDPMEKSKKAAAEHAANFVKEGMVVGLGSGSTANWMIKRLGERVQEGLNIKGIPSSFKSERLAAECGIPLTDFSSVEKIDIAIDGADEVDSDLQLLKGGGGSLVREKIVDEAAEQLIIIVDETKIVKQLGEFPLPIEVTPFGWELTAGNISKLGGKPKLRYVDGEIFVTNNDNYILDCKFPGIQKPAELHASLKLLTGVVETGLFINMADQIIIAKQDGIEILTK